MKRAVNYLRGWTQLRVTGDFPERMLNLCAQRRVPFWALEWVDGETFHFRVPTRWVSRLLPLAERTRCTLCRERSVGLPAFLAGFRHRYAFLAGLALSLLAVCVLSNFILWVDITGCRTVSQAEILTELRRLGVYPGAYGPSIDGSAVGQQALLNLSGLSWMSVNVSGARVEVIVREAVAPPQVDGRDGAGDIVAETDGVISRMEVLTGQARRQVGDGVTRGEVLISGTVELAHADPEQEPERYQVRAAGRVWADTRRVLTAAIPVTAQVKEYTGEETVRYSLSFLGKTINFYQNSGIAWPYYDRINITTCASLPDGRELPFHIVKTELRAYDIREVQVDLTAAEQLLSARLEEELAGLLGEDGEVLERTWESRVTDGVLTVTLTAACREEIGTEAAG